MRFQIRILRAACGLLAISTASAQPSTTQPYCPLSRDAVEQAFGASIGEARVGVHNRTVTTCSFPIEGGGSLSILLRRNAGRAWIAEQEQRMNGSVRHGRFYPVAGLGGEAFMLDMRAAGAVLCVFRGNDYVQVSVFKAGAAATVFPGAEKVARATLTRLVEYYVAVSR